MDFQTILVPFDFSKFSELAVQTACKLCERLGAELHLVHIQPGEVDLEAERQARTHLITVIPPSAELKTKVFREVLHGKIHEELLEYAKRCNADLIVMGTRGRSGILRIALGSVAARMLNSAPCPVMVVNPDLQLNMSAPDKSDEDYVRLNTTDSPALDLVARAIGLRATDIHIDPGIEEQYQVRLRIDGRLISYCKLDQSVASHLIHQFYTLAKLDHAEPFRPREGRLQLPSNMEDIEVRLTASPVAGGEAIALRLFSKKTALLPLEHLGLGEDELANVRRMLQGKEGLVLVTGPTGSGKTTTVYSMLALFVGDARNIVSIEDPVEFSVPFARQLNVDVRHDLTLTTGLRTLLRMDPDVIFIGEIRDPENAGIALRAASSGRFVFSSLHTRDVASTITALRDLEVTNHSLAGNMVGVINQRLVRRLCLQCRKPVAVPPPCQEAFADYHLEVPTEIFEPVGCDACRGSGYYGRSGVFESVVFNGEIADAIAENATESELRRLIRTQGNASLMMDALRKVRDGVTSFKEAQSIHWL
jgi:type II secretory ATPase GspE/PulE/Tfp pilus assembly ATPase PilB-like protein/nucleotide-binding universal stress UspA family protein